MASGAAAAATGLISPPAPPAPPAPPTSAAAPKAPAELAKAPTSPAALAKAPTASASRKGPRLTPAPALAPASGSEKLPAFSSATKDPKNSGKGIRRAHPRGYAASLCHLYRARSPKESTCRSHAAVFFSKLAAPCTRGGGRPCVYRNNNSSYIEWALCNKITVYPLFVKRSTIRRTIFEGQRTPQFGYEPRLRHSTATLARAHDCRACHAKSSG